MGGVIVDGVDRGSRGQRQVRLARVVWAWQMWAWDTRATWAGGVGWSTGGLNVTKDGVCAGGQGWSIGTVY